MKSYFKVETIENLKNYRNRFDINDTEKTGIENITGRVIAQDIIPDEDIPGFTRSTMDGYAVISKDTFGATESSPLYLNLNQRVVMGENSDFSISPGEAAPIGTGGMLPENSDSVIMVENTYKIAEDEIEIYKSISSGTNIINRDDDFKKDLPALKKGTRISSKNTGVLAACGKTEILTFRQPLVGIISTGDEVVHVSKNPQPGKVRDINRYLISSISLENGYKPVFYGLAKDSKDELKKLIQKAVDETDIVIISGGSSVGMRDITIDSIMDLQDPEILIHGLAMSPGKPAILARSNKTPIWGLPGHPASCFIVFYIAVLPFINYLSGLREPDFIPLVKAELTRNIFSAPGRDDFIRVKLFRENNKIYAKPILGESGLIRTLADCNGLLEIPANKEGGLQGEEFFVHILK